MVSLYELGKILNSSANVVSEPIALAHRLIQTSEAACGLLRTRLQEHLSADLTSFEDTQPLRPTIASVYQCFQPMLMGYHRLGGTDNRARIQGSVTYAFVRIYTDTLQLMQDAAQAHAETEKPSQGTSMCLRPRRKAARTAKWLCNTLTQTTTETETTPVLRLLVVLLDRWIELISDSIQESEALFEGLTFAVIERLGSTLHALCLKERRPSKIENEIWPCDDVNAPQSSQRAELNRCSPPDLAAAKLLASTLVHLLCRIMNGAPLTFMGATDKAKAGKSRVPNSREPHKQDLAISAKERLQQTLINSVFGTEGMDVNDPFLDCLRMPVNLNHRAAMPKKEQDKDVGDWFIQQLWRMLGWEIIARECDS